MKKTRRFLGAALAAAVFGSMSGYVVSATSTPKVTSYNGLEFTQKAADIWGAEIHADDLKSTAFSEADSTVGRDLSGYYLGYHISDADSTGATCTTAYTYAENLNETTIKSLNYNNSVTSTDGDFWTNYRMSYLRPAGKDGKPYLVHAVKVVNGTTTNYYYQAVKWTDLPADFAFDNSEDCANAGSHSVVPCSICGSSTGDVEYTGVDYTYTLTGANDTERNASAQKILDCITGVEINASGEIVVTFNKTQNEIKSIVNGDPILQAGGDRTTVDGIQGVDPVYLYVTTDIPGATPVTDFNWTGGYGWDDSNDKTLNFNNGNIILWLPAGTYTSKSITYTIGGKEQTLTVKFNYGTAAAKPAATKPAATTKPASDNTGSAPVKNPPTGITLAAAPAILAAGAAIVAAKKRK